MCDGQMSCLITSSSFRGEDSGEWSPKVRGSRSDNDPLRGKQLQKKTALGENSQVKNAWRVIIEKTYL